LKVKAIAGKSADLVTSVFIIIIIIINRQYLSCRKQSFNK